eukprot:3254457-Pyramimonas_sp.AAC.3
MTASSRGVALSATLWRRLTTAASRPLPTVRPTAAWAHSTMATCNHHDPIAAKNRAYARGVSQSQQGTEHCHLRPRDPVKGEKVKV